MTGCWPETTVIIPTVGRRRELSRCLDAVLTCDPRPDEVIVVDQSHAADDLLGGWKHPRVRVIKDYERGAGRARNQGARAAVSRLLLFVDDDCVPDREWVGNARKLHRLHPNAILTGSVLPDGDRQEVPSTRTDAAPVDHTGSVSCSALYSGNMAMAREEFLLFGGFDERFRSAGGEDNDLCYRWLRAGGELRYEPSLVVVHLDWRSQDQTQLVWAEYGRTQGMFYAKHLRRHDLQMLRFLAWDLRKLILGRLTGRPPRTPDMPALGPTMRSIVRNWRRFR